MPAGLLTTVPCPEPLRVTLTSKNSRTSNVAAHVRSWLIIKSPSVQSGSPDHPMNSEPKFSDAKVAAGDRSLFELQGLEATIDDQVDQRSVRLRESRLAAGVQGNG